MKLIITNNKILLEKDFADIELKYVDVDSLEILHIVRDEIHKGALLLTHPLSGSVKPNENPYKSIMIDKKTGHLDYRSLDIIEKAIMVFKKFNKMGVKRVEAEGVEEDYSLIDYTLISSFL